MMVAGWLTPHSIGCPARKIQSVCNNLPAHVQKIMRGRVPSPTKGMERDFPCHLPAFPPLFRVWEEFFLQKRISLSHRKGRLKSLFTFEGFVRRSHDETALQ